MRQPSTSAGAPTSLCVRRLDQRVDALPAATPSASEVASPARAHRRRRARGLAGVGVDDDEPPGTRMVRRRREARGLDERVEQRAGTGSGRNARIDRRASTKPGTPAQRNRSSCGGRTSSRTEPSRRHERSRPRTIAAGTLAALPITSSARRRDLVGDRDLGHLQLPPERVRWCREGRRRPRSRLTPIATSVRPVPPRPAERVRDDHRDVDPLAGAERVADVRGRTVGVDGEERGPAVLDVREVDAGVGAHEAVTGLADDQVAAPAHDADRLRFDEPAPGVAIVGVERDEAALGLRHDLLGDDEAVAGRREACPGRGPRRR